MKRILFFCMVLFITSSLVFAGGGQSRTSGATTAARGVGDWKYKYPQTVTATMGRSINMTNYFDGENYENNAYTRWIKDTYNYEIRTGFLSLNNDDYIQRVTLAIASGDIPDLMQVGRREQLMELMESGMVEDLTGLYDQWASPLLKASVDTFGGL